MRVVALMPFKANSERVPGKNFRALNGKPLFEWTLSALREVPAIDYIVINTDARDLIVNSATEPLGQRVKIKDRPQEICGDYISMNAVILSDVLDYEADIYVMTHTTNPLLSSATVNEALKVFQEALKMGSADCLFSVTKVQARLYTEQAEPVNHDPANLIPTQHLEPLFEENSNLYLFTKDGFLKERTRISERPILFETPYLESVDIDTPEDWHLAECLIENRVSNKD